MALKGIEAAAVEDNLRVWEVRKYCQVKPSFVQYDRRSDQTARDGSHRSPGGNDRLPADTALTALLRCLVMELDADLAMISLLDHSTQYFLSGATKSMMHSAQVTLESTKWYGCDTVLHHGGLCERTITKQDGVDCRAIYQELDMAQNERTKDLPFVDGTIAKFRHYAGVPITTASGYNIGTVFVFNEQVSTSGVSQQQHQYMTDISIQVMHQLQQSVEALENRRSIRFNKAVATMLDVRHSGSDAHPLPWFEHLKRSPSSKELPPLVLHMYRRAADLLSSAFDLDGVLLQKIPLSKRKAAAVSTSRSDIWAESLKSSVAAPDRIPPEVVDVLMETFPQGGVLQRCSTAEDAAFAASTTEASMSFRYEMPELHRALPEAHQILFMPLWDTFHDRTVAFAIGWATTYDRVYTSAGDLSPMSAFCMTAMTQVRRMEAQVLEKTKSDFLGSISHEMRSPLHGTLASLELLSATECSEQQMDLVENARSSGLQLLETIDQILQYSNISSPGMDQERSERGSFDSSHRNSLDSGLGNGEDKSERNEEVDLAALCEDIVERVGQRTNPPGTPSTSASRRQSSLLPSPGTARSNMATSSERSIITFDMDTRESCTLQSASSLRTVCENLLTNAVKYTGSGGIVRLSLNVNDTDVSLRFTDSGKGMPQDFIQNGLYVPFSQADPLNPGTGLGLSVVKHIVDGLCGSIKVKSDVDVGTTVSITVPKVRVARPAAEHEQEGSAVVTTPATPATSTATRELELPSLTARVWIPHRWQNNQDRRAERCVDALLASLEHNMSGFAQAQIGIWQEGEPTPDLMFVSSNDLEDARRSCGDAWADTKRIVLCPESAALGPLQENGGTDSGPEGLIFGPIVPSKLRHALFRVLPELTSPSQRVTSDLPGVDDAQGYFPPTPAATEEGAMPDSGARGEQSVPVSPHHVNGDSVQKQSNNIPDRTLASKPVETSEEKNDDSHRLLLVDDNAINLKVLGMYVSRCVSTPYVSVPGGQEAIDAFEQALGGPDAFDIIFMDISMPEVTGIDATIAIRSIETKAAVGRRTYIAALTSLVSGKDRSAAWNAGVDEYITKPAKIKDIQDVIDRYVERRKDLGR